MKYTKHILIAVACLSLLLPVAGLSKRAEDNHGDSHAGHDHGPQVNLDDLFDDESHEGHDDHAGHGGHDDHGDDHVRHDQKAEGDAHAGHGHEGHGHGASADGICLEHRVPEVECALCQGGQIDFLLPGQGMKVRLEAADAAERIGVAVAPPQRASGTAGLSLPGRVIYNRDRLARITPLAPGIIRQVKGDVGATVKKGQVLAELSSAQVASLRSALSSARSRESLTKATYQREKGLLEKGITSRQEFEEAEASWRAARNDLEQARQQLLNIGLTEKELGKGGGSALLPVRAPFAGTLVEKAAVMGEAVEPGAQLFSLADLGTMWIELSVPEGQIFQVAQGAAVAARFDGLPGRSFSGKIFLVASALDEKTRTLKAFAEVENPGHLLKSGLFGQVSLVEAQGAHAMEIPADALQSIDGKPFVFVRLEDDLFELRKVEAGARSGDMIQVARGLSASDQVVVTRGFALKSEVLKSRLGASCADH